MKNFLFVLFRNFIFANIFIFSAAFMANATPDSTYPFEITTTAMTGTNQTFKFSISATGNFVVDCGDGGTLSGTRVSGNTITRSDTNRAQYTCTYPTEGANNGVHTIRFGGRATGYNSTSRANAQYAPIGFSTNCYSGNTPAKIASISGSIGQIFPTLNNGENDFSKQPRFMYTFCGCSGLTSLPNDLFSGVSGAASYMFYSTFYTCTGLISLPDNLFSGVSGAAKAMFKFVFQSCTGLISIPANLFSGVSSAAPDIFGWAFQGCTSLTSIPVNLFSNVTGVPYSYMFKQTFQGCSNITGFTVDGNTVNYIPRDFLSGIDTDTSVTETVTDMFAGTSLLGTCLADAPDVTRQQFSDAGKPWCDGPQNTTTVININWDTGTGGDEITTTCTVGDVIVLPTEPTRPGYTFSGWRLKTD